MTTDRFDRNERFFGSDGQARLRATRLAIVGAGGLGSFVVAEAAYLGIGTVTVIDADVVTESSLNRLLGALPDDAARGIPKVDVAERVFRAIRPDSTVVAVNVWLGADEARAAIEGSDVIMGCLDDDYARLQLTGIAAAAGLPLIDLATEIQDEGRAYGGRVAVAQPGRRCLSCLDVLDRDELALGGLTPEQRTARDRSYGVAADQLGAEGASVVPINGVVASLGMTELMVSITGLREPRIELTYVGQTGTVRVRTQEPTQPCFYCGRGTADTGPTT
jgi:molybdopterin/thiamine biosynthesis adenylyltransferase